MRPTLLRPNSNIIAYGRSPRGYVCVVQGGSEDYFLEYISPAQVRAIASSRRSSAIPIPPTRSSTALHNAQELRAATSRAVQWAATDGAFTVVGLSYPAGKEQKMHALWRTTVRKILGHLAADRAIHMVITLQRFYLLVDTVQGRITTPPSFTTRTKSVDTLSTCHSHRNPQSERKIISSMSNDTKLCVNSSDSHLHAAPVISDSSSSGPAHLIKKGEVHTGFLALPQEIMELICLELISDYDNWPLRKSSVLGLLPLALTCKAMLPMIQPHFWSSMKVCSGCFTFPKGLSTILRDEKKALLTKRISVSKYAHKSCSRIQERSPQEFFQVVEQCPILSHLWLDAPHLLEIPISPSTARQLKVLSLNIIAHNGIAAPLPPMPQLHSLALQTSPITDEDFVEFVNLDHLPRLLDLKVTIKFGLFTKCNASSLFCGVSTSIQSVSLSGIADLGIIKQFGPSIRQLYINCCGFDRFDPSTSLPELRSLTATSRNFYQDAEDLERIRIQLRLDYDDGDEPRRRYTTIVMRRCAPDVKIPE